MICVATVSNPFGLHATKLMVILNVKRVPFQEYNTSVYIRSYLSQLVLATQGTRTVRQGFRRGLNTIMHSRAENLILMPL